MLHVIFIKQVCRSTMPEAIQTPLFHTGLLAKTSYLFTLPLGNVLSACLSRRVPVSYFELKMRWVFACLSLVIYPLAFKVRLSNKFVTKYINAFCDYHAKTYFKLSCSKYSYAALLNTVFISAQIISELVLM